MAECQDCIFLLSRESYDPMGSSSTKYRNQNSSMLNQLDKILYDKENDRNPVEFLYFMKNYYEYTSAFGWSEKTMIQRLPLYIRDLALGMFKQINTKDMIYFIEIKDALFSKLFPDDIGRTLRKFFLVECKCQEN